MCVPAYRILCLRAGFAINFLHSSFCIENNIESKNKTRRAHVSHSHCVSVCIHAQDGMQAQYPGLFEAVVQTRLAQHAAVVPFVVLRNATLAERWDGRPVPRREYLVIVSVHVCVAIYPSHLLWFVHFREYYFI